MRDSNNYCITILRFLRIFDSLSYDRKLHDMQTHAYYYLNDTQKGI